MYCMTDVWLLLFCRVDYECPDNCSGQGVCQDGVCRCDPGWVGELCHLPACPGDCLGNGVCNDSLQQCVCFEGFIGVCVCVCVHVCVVTYQG